MLKDFKVIKAVVGGRLVGYFSKEMGQKYLFNTLSSIPGLPSKVVQTFSMKEGVTEVSCKIEPLSNAEVKTLIGEGSRLDQDLKTLEECQNVASIGQVHFAYLKSGKQVAIKVMYPGVKKEIQEQFQTALKLFSKRPVAQEFSLDIEGIRKFFSDHLEAETDYRKEALQQIEFYKLWKSSPFVVVPKVYEEYTQDNILVQSYEKSEGLDEINKYDETTRQEFANQLIQFFCMSVFLTGVVHADFHPQNYGFRLSEKKIILYDFGSILKLENQWQVALFQLVQELKKTPEEISEERVQGLLVLMGFDSKALEKISTQLCSVAQLLFQPLVEEESFDFKKWKVKLRLEELLGGDQWWLRSACPPWFLQLMKATQGLVHALKSLDVDFSMSNARLSDYAILNPSLRRLLPVITPRRKNVQSMESSEVVESKVLKILVQDSGETLVSLDMPVRCVDRIETLIPKDRLDSIVEQGYDIEEIKTKVIDSKYRPQILLDVDLGSKVYKIWLQ